MILEVIHMTKAEKLKAFMEKQNSKAHIAYSTDLLIHTI